MKVGEQVDKKETIKNIINSNDGIAKNAEYPELDTSNHWKKTVPSQGLSDLITQALKDETN